MSNLIDTTGRPAAGGSTRGKRAPWAITAALTLGASLCLFSPGRGLAQQPPTTSQKEQAPPPSPAVAGTESEEILPGDLGSELLYGILSSSNEEAQFELLRATFAAGPAIVPQLTAALKDDRTAEYAAQALAYIGGEKALNALWGLLSDPRDLNLRRFTYGALAEFDSPQATDLLFEAIDNSDAEPDRTVTESAVIALTARSDTSLLPRLLSSEKKLEDVVIRDDLDNAREVIQARAKYLASPEGKKAGGSIETAVRTYFIPALEPPSAAGVAGGTAPASAGKPPASTASKGAGTPPAAATASAAAKTRPLVSVDVRSVTLSPDQDRALARVVFEDPSAIAFYDFVLQKRYGSWTLVSVWLGPEVEKAGSGTPETGPESPR